MSSLPVEEVVPPAPHQPLPPVPIYKINQEVLIWSNNLLYVGKLIRMARIEGDDDAGWTYRVHYKGWAKSWDAWKPELMIMPITDENLELLMKLMAEVPGKSKGKQKNAKRLKKAPAGRSKKGIPKASGQVDEAAQANASPPPPPVVDEDTPLSFLKHTFYPTPLATSTPKDGSRQDTFSDDSSA